MKKKVYLQPAVEYMEPDQEQLLMAGSVTDLNTIGLDVEDELELPDPGLSTGSIWDNAI